MTTYILNPNLAKGTFTMTIQEHKGGGFGSTPGTVVKKQVKPVENKAVTPKDDKAKDEKKKDKE